MAATKTLAAALLGGAVVAMVALDRYPAFHGAPLILLTCTAAILISREICAALAHRGQHPSGLLTGQVVALILLHVAYFRDGGQAELLLLIATIVAAVLTLVLVAALQTDCKLYGLGAAFLFLLQGLAISLVVGAAFSFAILMPSLPAIRAHVPEPEAGLGLGAGLVALVLAGAWLANGAAALVGRLDPRRRGSDRPGNGRPAPSVVSDLARVLTAVVVVAVGSPLLPRAAVPLSTALALGLLTGVAAGIGERAVRSLARHCGVDSFRHPLPRQLRLLQPLYDIALAGGLTDCAGGLVFVFPSAWLLLYGMWR